MALTNSYVGIGTTSPGEKLDVSGDIRAVNIKLGYRLYHDGEDPENTYIQYSDDQILLATGGSARMKINADGIHADKICGYDDEDTHIDFVPYDSIKFTTGDLEVMRIHSNGNVGIGTSSPGTNHTAKLEVNGNIKGEKYDKRHHAFAEGTARNAHLYIGGNGGNNTWGNSVYFGSGNTKIGDNGGIYITDGIYHKGNPATKMVFDTNVIRFMTGNPDTATEALRIDSSQRGIGTDEPNYRLTVQQKRSTQSDGVKIFNSSGDDRVLLGVNSFDNGQLWLYKGNSYAHGIHYVLLGCHISTAVRWASEQRRPIKI